MEERRRIIERALALRPDLDTSVLHETLRRLGLDVDDATLLADLDALGYDVGDEIDPESGEPVRTVPGTVRTDAEPAPQRSWQAASRRGRWAVAPVLVLLPLVVGLGLAKAGSAGTATARTTTTTSTTEARTGPPPTAPQGPGADPALAASSDASLAFDEPGPMPPVGVDRPWELAIGTWEVLDARVVGAADQGNGALATFDAGERDVRMEVALPDAYDSTGLAFSVEDGTYLLWAPADGFPTIALYRVTAEGAAFVLHSQQTDLGPGMRLGIHIDGDEVELLAGGAVVATYQDPGTSTRVGLAVGPAEAFGTFDDLVVDLAGSG